MSLHPFFNQIELSQVQPHKADPNNQSLIQELNMLQTATSSYQRTTKIQSFIYAEPYPSITNEPKFYQNEAEALQISQVRNFPSDHIKSERILKGQKKFQIPKDHNQGCKPSQIKSIRQQLIEENKLLQQKLRQNNLNRHQRVSRQQIVPLCYKSNKHSYKEFAKAQAFADKSLQQNRLVEFLQDQYNRSNVIKLYNFITKELPKCSRCSNPCNQIIEEPDYNQIGCKDCFSVRQNSRSLIGILYDLENKPRFQDELSAFQGSLEAIDSQVGRLQRQLCQLETLKQKIIMIKHLSRKQYKDINQSKQYLKQQANNINTNHLQKLVKILPKEYLTQLQLWEEIEKAYKHNWKHIYTQIFRIMPIFLHDHKQSNLLSALHKLLNYQNEHSVKIAVSEPIKFPLKKIEKAVLVVDGSYNLPVFDNIHHLQLQFQNKKTQRQLSLLFSNFPRTIYSLKFSYDHKAHSHISAETFPFFKHLATFSSIKQLEVQIKNVKDFTDVMKLSISLTQMIDLRIRITRHIFCQQRLLLPQDFFDNLMINLGRDLVRCEIQLPYSIDSPVRLNYDKCFDNKLCFLKISRVQRDDYSKRNFKLLQQMDQRRILAQKKRQKIFNRLLGNRLRMVYIIRKFNFDEFKAKSLLSSVQSLL